MKIIFAEAILSDQVKETKDGKLCYARVLSVDSLKYEIINKLFESKVITFFLKIGEYFNNFVSNDLPLVIVTDWDEPTEMYGLRLEYDNGVMEFSDLHFLAFRTDWEDIKMSGIEEIFAHELSHLWLNYLGFDISLSKSNKFHTCTAITDPYMAFSEGLAEHFEIVTRNLIDDEGWLDNFWDTGYDINAWISNRDKQLRYHATINNRFIYHTASPEFNDFETYNQLHIAHITSSSFVQEKIKNSNQMMASEGVIATIFYCMYNHELFKNTFLDDCFYKKFGAEKSNISSDVNLYLKIFYILSKIDLSKNKLMTEFIEFYGCEFPNEKKDLYDIFLKITHYSTVDTNLSKAFEKQYYVGRSGDINTFRELFVKTTNLKNELNMKVLNGELKLDQTITKELWICADEEITPTPWAVEEKSKYNFDINTATEIDLMSLNGITYEVAKRIIRERDKQSGFKTLAEFYVSIKKV